MAQLAIARGEITVGKSRVSDEMNLGRQIKKSIQNHPLGWFAGTMGAATFLGLIGRRKIKVISPRKRFKTLRWILGIGFTLAKPTLTTLLVARAKEEAEKRLGTASLKSMLGGPSQK